MKEIAKIVSNRRRTHCAATLVVAAMASAAQLATAQVEPAAAVGAAAGAAANDPAGQMRFYVELKDSTLADALENGLQSGG